MFSTLHLLKVNDNLPVEVVDPKDKVELIVEFKLSMLPPWPAPPGLDEACPRPAGVKLTPTA